jgi:GNAT superfamily N-acetyltransferase
VASDVEIRPLLPTDDRTGFACGQPDLDRFFEHYAGQNQFKLRIAVTCVAVLDRRLLGFATVASSALERESVPSARLRKRLPGYPLPVVRLARLGVDTRARGFGLGRALVRRVFSLALEERDRIGCIGVVADAKAGAVKFYESLGFVPVEGVREGRLVSEPLPMFLGIETIASALER